MRRCLRFSLAMFLVVLTFFAIGLGVGRLIWYPWGFRDGWHQGPLRGNVGQEVDYSKPPYPDFIP